MHYTKEVQQRRQSSLISSPPKAPARRLHLPHRSARIVSQPLNHIPTAKRGEVLLMKKMGMPPPQATVTSALKRAYEAIFTGNWTDS